MSTPIHARSLSGSSSTRFPLANRVLAHDELEHLREVVVDPAKRYSETLGDVWNRCALDDDGEQDDDEDDPVQLWSVVDAAE